MERAVTVAADKAWQQFVLEYGWQALSYEMAHVLGRTAEEIDEVRRTGACKKLNKRKRFSELFSLWHGRLPEETEWPAPRRYSANLTYEWQEPEIALLASLVGVMGPKEIVATLTSRLRRITGDASASRNMNAVQNQVNNIGLQFSKDVLGGITTAEAGKEIGSLAIVNQVVHKGDLKARKVGRLLVIDRKDWESWKAKRSFPPEGYVQLSSIRETLAIRSDKLSEFARMGYVPTAVRCNPYGTKGKSTQFGTWYIDSKVAEQLVADRHAGKPMPWHGKPLLDNLKSTYKVWIKRKHPEGCKTCAEIWGKEGAPATFEEYIERYPPLAHGAKRHLTRQWSPGMTLAEVADYTGQKIGQVQYAIDNGTLESKGEGDDLRVTRTDATLWKARKCPSGDGAKSWIPFDNACKQYLFTERELRAHIDNGDIVSKIGEIGEMKGLLYVAKNQCRRLRERLGFTEDEAARKIGITVERFRILLKGVHWRKEGAIPLETVQAVVKRLESKEGYSLEEAAEKVGESLQWVLDRKRDGTIKVSQAKWDRRRQYITKPMLQRLITFKNAPDKIKQHFGPEWLQLSDAAGEAGVTSATVIRWADRGELERRESLTGARYHREAVRARARTYWDTVRFHRAVPPSWLQEERLRINNRKITDPEEEMEMS